jgi:hypothetical protein
MSFTDAERRKIMAEANANIDRLADLVPREVPIERLRRSEPAEQPEPEPGPELMTDAMRARATAEASRVAGEAWQAWVHREIGEALLAAAGGLVEAVREQIEERDEKIEALQRGLAARDRRLERMEAEAARLAAEVARVQLRLTQDAADRERRSADWTTPPGRRELN